jgi:hypothetical protein
LLRAQREQTEIPVSDTVPNEDDGTRILGSLSGFDPFLPVTNGGFGGRVL